MENRIRELRKKKKLTMKELGAMLGLAESTISQYETGKRQPDNETLLKLGELFGVTVGYILGVENEEAPTPQGERPVGDDELKFALFGTQEIDDEILEEVKAFARFAQDRRKDR